MYGCHLFNMSYLAKEPPYISKNSHVAPFNCADIIVLNCKIVFETYQKISLIFLNIEAIDSAMQR